MPGSSLSVHVVDARDLITVKNNEPPRARVKISAVPKKSIDVA